MTRRPSSVDSVDARIVWPFAAHVDQATQGLILPGELGAKGEGAERHGVATRGHGFEWFGAGALSADLIVTKLSYLGSLGLH